jgi:hypothetical protein
MPNWFLPLDQHNIRRRWFDRLNWVHIMRGNLLLPSSCNGRHRLHLIPVLGWLPVRCRLIIINWLF